MSDTPRFDALMKEAHDSDVFVELARQLERELTVALKDAERYRFIRENWGVSFHVEDSDMKGDKLDAAVDAAMKP